MKALHLLPLLLLAACTKATPDPKGAPPAAPALYYPPVTGHEWLTTTPSAEGWNETALQELYTFLGGKGTKAFLVLKGGKLAAERYYGSFNRDSVWYWASAGKTATALLVGIAQAEGRLRLDEPTATYLGAGWTSLPPAEEARITVRHQLSMTSGLDDGTGDVDCTLPSCLQYKAAPGARWAYHNAPYTLLEKVVENATGKTFNTYFTEKVRDRTGITGLWVRQGYNNVHVSTARSAARFGLLLLGRGRWDGHTILPDSAYLAAQTTTSQGLNPAYGYLTWLNGKASHMLPGTQLRYNGPLIPAAPADMYAALGKNDQKIYVVPSLGLVVVRMGESAGNVQMATSSFDNELWTRLKEVLRY